MIIINACVTLSLIISNPKLILFITVLLASCPYYPPLLLITLTLDQPLTSPLLSHSEKFWIFSIQFLPNHLRSISYQLHFSNQYADDTQFYISISAKTIAPNTRRLEACLSDLLAWFSHNWLALKPFQIGGSPTRYQPTAENPLNTQLSQHLRHHCSTHNPDQTPWYHTRPVSFDSHITALSKSCFYHIRALRHIRPILSEGTANLIASALVSSRLDYANTCLYGISNKNLSRIQRIQNTLARVVTCSKSRSSSAPLLMHLQWLPVSARIHFKIALLTFKSLHTIVPSYLSSLIHPYVPSRALRSSSAHRLCVSHVSTVFGSRGFRSASPTIWNSLPFSVTSCSTIHTFKKQLKTHLFASAFPSSWIIDFDAPLIWWSPLIYLFGYPWFCACLNVCYYYYYY